MENQIQVIEPAAGLMKSTMPCFLSALDDRPWSARSGSWSADAAAIRLCQSGADLDLAETQLRAALEPCPQQWLADRLRLLWKSSAPARSLDAKAWAHETGRLLTDIPQDILAWAIDEAIKTSSDDFMPGVGRIRALAAAKFAQRKTQLERLMICKSLIEGGLAQ